MSRFVLHSLSWRRLFAPFLVAASALSSAAAANSPASPPLATAKAVVVDSADACDSSGVIWETLNQNWSQFGAVRVRINYRDADLCGGAIVTYEALVASGAQTVILSNTTGSHHVFDASEIDALTRYAQEGHNLVGTFILLQYGAYDNRALAPLFGLDPTVTYGKLNVSGAKFKIRANSPLFAGMGGQYTAGGYLGTQTPPGNQWTDTAAGQASVLGYDTNRHAAILSYCGPGYRAFFFTQEPEYGGDTQDQQLFYNALVLGRHPGC